MERMIVEDEDEDEMELDLGKECCLPGNECCLYCEPDYED